MGAPAEVTAAPRAAGPSQARDHGKAEFQVPGFKWMNVTYRESEGRDPSQGLRTQVWSLGDEVMMKEDWGHG